jgi:hypothetical protein
MSRATATSKRQQRRHQRTVEVGPGVVQASFEDIAAALRALDPDLPWADAAEALLPVFPRRRPLPGEAPPPIWLERPPGVQVGVAVDVGPAFLFVSEELLDRWGVAADDALDRAVVNVRERCRRRRMDPVFRGTVGDVPTMWFQSGESIGSALLLMPDEIARRLGSHPQFVMAPMRDLLVSVPIDAGITFATWLREAIAEDDPNCLELPVFSLVDGELRIAAPPGVPGGVRVH